MRLTNPLLLLYLNVGWAIADITFTTPAAGAILTANTAFLVTFASSGSPALADFSSYTLTLYAGSNTAPVGLTALMPAGTTFATNPVSVTIPPGVGGEHTNAYFLGVNAVATNGYVLSYSSRFSVSGMTGVFSTAVNETLADISGTAGPANVDQIAATSAATAAADTDGLYGVTYTAQVGLTKYAPMQPLPPTSITATNTAPLYPTSSYSIATTYLPIPSVVTTLTEAATYSFSSHANTAAAASQPTDAMQRFLNRWKD